MKNLEVKFSLSELEFYCKNLFLIWGKRCGEQEFDGRIFHMEPTSITWRFLCKSRKMSRDRTVDLENGCDRTRE